MVGFYGQSLGPRSGDLAGGSALNLPGGACGYRDLSAGAKAPTCGCRRFWLNAGHIGNPLGEPAWCFCGHHACFHDGGNVRASHSQNADTAIEHTRSALPSSHQANVAAQPGVLLPPTWSELIGEHVSVDQDDRGNRPRTPSQTGLGIQHTEPGSPPQSINARLWQALNGFARNQDDTASCADTSKLPSTAVPSVCEQPMTVASTRRQEGYVRASYHDTRPPITIPTTGAHAQGIEEYSATEVATPSLRGTPDLGTAAPVPVPIFSPRQFVSPTQATAPSRQNAQARPTDVTQPTPPPTARIQPALSIQEMCNTIHDFGHRIASLESISFSYMPSDTIQDKFDLLDGRVIDIEHWRTEQDREQLVNDTDDRLKQTSERLDELEQWRHDHDQTHSSQQSDGQRGPSHSKNRSKLHTDTSSCASDGSFDEEAAAQTETVVLATLAASAETRPRIDALESRILNLEATLPSFSRPWAVQVVLLPFSRLLPGIWFSASESSHHHSLHSQASTEWMGPQTALTSSFRSTASNGWTTESIEAWNRGVDQEEEWLSPKACGPSGTVFQRLASRGLVRNVVLQAPDSHHIWDAISNAFGPIMRGNDSVKSLQEGSQGLRERFVPLRKVRKSARLRFLSPAEMVTSTNWNALFLDSVCMKVNEGERRLYLTTPEGYLQPHESAWSWRSIRDLPVYGLDGELQAAQLVGRAIEACWTRNDRLDQALSLHSSFQSEEFGWGTSSEGSGPESGQVPEAMLPSPSTTRHSHIRSLSFPSSTSTHALDIESALKRRAASFEAGSTVPTLEYSAEFIAKRRRVSRSPELERKGVNFTPRWSREPPSPFIADDPMIGRSSQATSSRHRGTTPFAYATPHSHLDSRAGADDDTEINDNDHASAHGGGVEDVEEWEGVQDGQLDSVFRNTSQSEEDGRGNNDIDDQHYEEEMDDGMNSYKL